MKDYRASIEKLRKEAAEAAMIRDLAADTIKRKTFNRLHNTSIALPMRSSEL
jgi:hypothetical protein